MKCKSESFQLTGGDLTKFLSRFGAVSMGASSSGNSQPGPSNAPEREFYNIHKKLAIKDYCSFSEKN